MVLLRHGQSTWNEANLFTGWFDADLTEQGVAEARRGGELLADADLAPDVVHTSVQRRAIHTAQHALDTLHRDWIPVRRHWRLNERHYGDLQGKDKKQTTEEHGRDQVKLWRRSYDVPPPPLADDDERHARHDPRYADLAPELIPASECLKDVVERMLPYWFDGIVPDLRAGRLVLVAAHGNSLRALVKHLEQIPDDAIAEVNIPTGLPLVYELDESLRPVGDLDIEDRYLGGAEAARAAAEAVARQAG